jgi:histidinol-phosphate phosphatase family protein
MRTGSLPMSGTVFLDRDGVINVNRRDSVKRWEELEFLPRALEGLALLTKHGYQLVVVTNQSVVSRGFVSSAELDELHARMLAVIAHHGGRVSGVLYCSGPERPHQAGGSPPAPGRPLGMQRCCTRRARRSGVDCDSLVRPAGVRPGTRPRSDGGARGRRRSMSATQHDVESAA